MTCTSYSIYFLEGGASNDTWVDVGTTYSCIMSGKFRIPWCVAPESDANKRNVNIPIIRYSDVLLMYAEAQNYLNGAPTQPAKDALKEIRDRAGRYQYLLIRRNLRMLWLRNVNGNLAENFHYVQI